MPELEPISPEDPASKEHLFGPTEPILIIKGDHTITQERGWTRCLRVVGNENNNMFWLKGLGLKEADHEETNTNIYRVYPQLPANQPVPQFDNTVVGKDLKCEANWGPYKATPYDPSLRDNKYFAEAFCNRPVETVISDETISSKGLLAKIKPLAQLITRPLRLTLEAASHILTPWTRLRCMIFG